MKSLTHIAACSSYPVWVAYACLLTPPMVVGLLLQVLWEIIVVTLHTLRDAGAEWVGMFSRAAQRRQRRNLAWRRSCGPYKTWPIDE